MPSDDSYSSSLGCGIGLRSKHYDFILSEKPKVDWFEAVSENYMDTGGRPLTLLEEIRKNYPIALHGVALSIGSVDPLNPKYLKRLKCLADHINPFIVSDHICWAGVGGESLHDLLPLPWTQDTLEHVIGRVKHVQDFLGRRILLENVSTYISYKHSSMTEWEFVRTVAEQSGCGLLLDINNVYVNSKNHGFDPHLYIREIPGDLVGQIHLAGHTDKGPYLFDTHSKPVIEAVWDLYREALQLWGRKSTLLEWDEDIPEFEILAKETLKAKKIHDRIPTGQKTREPEKKEKPPASLSSDPPSKTDPKLEDLEHWMKLQIYHEHSEPQIFKVEDIFLPQGGEAPEIRIEVYRGGYLARTKEALLEAYPAVYHVLGDEVFTRTAEDYAQHYPSQDYNLSLKGREFAAYLDRSSLRENLPFLTDLAKLEWAVSEAFHAVQQMPWDPRLLKKLRDEEWNGLHLKFQTSVKLVASDWPVLDIWESRHKPLHQIKIDLINRPQKIFIFRPIGTEVYCQIIENPKFKLLTMLFQGRTLGETVSFLAERIEEPLPLHEWFQEWMKYGLIVDGSPSC